MNLPEALQQAIEDNTQHARLNSLAKARENLSLSYKEDNKQHMLSEADRLSYLATRMPATYATICKVLHELIARMPNVQWTSLLDLGAGPGTVLWASHQVLGSLKATLIEQDLGLIALGKKLALAGNLNAEWISKVLTSETIEIPFHDLSVFSYSYSEFPQDKRLQLLQSTWNATEKVLIVIEPGTPRGYRTILEARSKLLELGGFMVAPCPHALPCPMQEDDWCHFSVRLERSSLHRSVKDAHRGFEDEKFSYIIISKQPVELPENRIVRYPKMHSGHVNLTLCSQKDQIVNTTVSRKQGALYKQARDCEWGDPWPK